MQIIKYGVAMTREIILTVNEETVKLDYFVQGLMDHTVTGMLSALEGTGDIITAEINVNGEIVKVIVNNKQIPVNEFASKILRNTIKGMISSLKGVNEINQLHIRVRK